MCMHPEVIIECPSIWTEMSGPQCHIGLSDFLLSLCDNSICNSYKRNARAFSSEAHPFLF